MTDIIDTAPSEHVYTTATRDQDALASEIGRSNCPGGGAGFAVCTPNYQLPVWDRPVPRPETSRPAPAVWLLGAHGGAGTSTLARVLAPAAECDGRWPAPFPAESPFVILIARETVPGLVKAQDLLRQHAAGLAGSSRVLGLVTVADRPTGRMPTAVRQTRDIAAALVEHAWRLGWIESYPRTADLAHLPAWSPRDPAPTDKNARHNEPPREVVTLGVAIQDALRTSSFEYPTRQNRFEKGHNDVDARCD